MIELSDRTIHKCAADIYECINTLDALDSITMPKEMRFQIKNNAVTILAYVTNLLEAVQALEKVELILLNKAPAIIQSWRKIRLTILEDEAKHRILEMNFDVEDTSQASLILEAIKRRA